MLRKSALLLRCLSLVLLWLSLSAAYSAAPVITSVTESGGDGTVFVQWSGNTFTAYNGATAIGNYTVPMFSTLARAYNDRLHAYTNCSASVPLPAYLVGNPYIMVRNDNRDNGSFRLNVTVSQDVMVYMLLDNRLADGSNANPPFNPTNITQWNSMQWMGTNGFRPVQTGSNRSANNTLPDEVGIDEAADGGINNFFSVYSNRYPAGTFTIFQQGLSGNNMYGVVVVGVGVTAPPAAPLALTAVSGDAQVTLGWSNMLNTTGYNVKRSTVSGGPYSVIGTTSTAAFTDTTVVNGTDYYYVVSGTNSLGESTNSFEVAAHPNPVVTGISAIGGTNAVYLTWSPLANATSYAVLRDTSASGGFTNVVASSLADTTYTDTQVLNGTTYYYRISASISGAGASGRSATVSAVTAPSAPVVRVNIFATTVQTVLWTTPDTVVSQFNVEVSTDGTTFAPLGSVAGNLRGYTNATLPPSTTYFYRVQATNAGGLSAYSVVASNTTPASGYNVNFATGSNNSAGNPVAPTPPGYVQDVGELFSTQGNGLNYGWSTPGGTNITRDARWRQNTNSPDLRYDTFNHMQKSSPATWEIEIPNGYYKVRVVGGDPTATDSVFQYNIEGVITVTNLPSTGNWWADIWTNAAVSDGRLTITSGPRASNNKIGFVEIYPDVPVAPGFVSQPQSATIEEWRPFTLSSSVTGSVTLVYQWWKNGSAIPDATNAAITFSRIRQTDSGDYFLVVTNYGGMVTSALATIVVNPDVTRPRIVSVGSVDGLSIGITFDEDINTDQPGATEPFNYQINGATVDVISVTPRGDGRSFVITLGQPITGQFYVETFDVPDYAGNGSLDARTNVVMGFSGYDVGGPAFTGSHFTSDSQSVQIVGGGADIWGNTDQGYFVTKTVTGNFDFKMRVTALAGSNTITKAVLVARETTNADSRNFHISVNPPPPGRDQGEMGYRATNGLGTAIVGSAYTNVAIPNAWIRMTRIGDTFSAWRSSDGVAWTIFAQSNAVFPSDMIVGFGITAHDNTLKATGTVSSISLSQSFADLAVTGSASPDPVTAAGTVNYSLTVTNSGTASAGTVVLTDVLPSSVTFVSASASQGSCANSSGTITCNLGAIAAGGVVTVTLSGTANVGGTITNAASVVTGDLETSTANNAAAIVSTVNATATPQRIVSLSYSGSSFSAAVQTQNGFTYRVQYKDDLNAVQWQSLTNIVGDGSLKPLSDASPNAAMRFYRIVIE